jgi:hypothetical protein
MKIWGVKRRLNLGQRKRFSVANLKGQGTSSIHKQVQTCYGRANQKPLLGLHGEEVEFEIIHTVKQIEFKAFEITVMGSFQ